MLRKWLLICLGLAVGHAWARPPRVAVWDPVKGSTESRVELDLPDLDLVSAWLGAAGVHVQRLTAEAIDDPAQFSAQVFDALMLQGGEFPRRNIAAYKRFADEGGVLMALGAKVPFLMGMERRGEGTWRLSPPKPTFAWQTSEVMHHVGVNYIYDPSRHDQGVDHAATPLLRRYLPDAPVLPRERLQGWWLVPYGGAEYYPLIRSRRHDGKDVPPQLFISRRGTRHAIVALDPCYTAPASERWPQGRATVVAMANIARDLRTGALKLSADARVRIDPDLPPPEPLQNRLPRGQVDPEGIAPVARWGRFDGASLELGEPLSAARTLGAGDPFPRALLPGGSVTLSPRGDFLRVRGAFAKTGAALSVSIGGQSVWHETLNYVDASGKGNWGMADIGNAPAEFHRIIFLPPPDGALRIGNTGSEPIYFDAVQLEADRRSAREIVMGLNYGYHGGWPEGHDAPPPLTKQWTSLRGIARTQYVGPPDDPARYDDLFARIDRQLTICPNIHLLLEGTAEWFAINPERYALGKSRNRGRCTAPDPQKYAQIVRDILVKFRDRVDAYEIWNEAESGHFYYGSHEEYIELFNTLVPIIRELDPGARIITTGMAGFRKDFVETFADSGAIEKADLFAFHPYAGKSPGWDIQYGMLEGSLYSLGIDIEVYCNESGFPYHNCQWFTAPPILTREMQREMLDVAMSRLLANGVAKLSVFHAGGNLRDFSLIGPDGVPFPAYRVFADYLPLSWNGGRRLDVSMVSADGSALQGVYVAAASHDDGSVTVVVNPSEVERLRPPRRVENPSREYEYDDAGHSFFGKKRIEDGRLKLVAADGKPYVGYSITAPLDLDRWPILEFGIPACGRTVQLGVKTGGAESLVFKDVGVGTHRVDLREALAVKSGIVDANLTIRALGGVEVDFIRFLEDPETSGRSITRVRPTPVDVVLRIPLTDAADRRGTLTCRGDVRAVPCTIHAQEDRTWADVRVAIEGRSVIRLK